MPYFREFVMPLLTAIIVGLLVWAYLDRRLRNTLVLSNASLLERPSYSSSDRQTTKGLETRRRNLLLAHSAS
jgi:hypothetical protein